MDLITKLNNVAQQLVKFALAGVVATSFHYLVLIVCVELGLLSAEFATVFGFSVGAFVNYFLAKYFVYQSQTALLPSALKFIIMVFFGAVVNQIVFMLLQSFMYYLLAQVCATAVVFLSNFIITKFWVFRD